MGSDSLKRSPLREQQQKNGPSMAGEMTLQRRNGAGFGSKEPSSRKRYDSEDLSPNSTEMFSDEGDSFLWRAHTVTALVIVVGILFYESLINLPTADPNTNHRRGIYAAIAVFIVVGVVNMPDGPFKRPHPYFWRFFLCVSILYLLGLIYLLFQDVDTARQMLRIYDPDLGKKLPERTYCEDCRLLTPGHENGIFNNIKDKMDVFVWSHLLGWYVKALIIRDVWLLNIISAGFEFAEYTLETQLPNFGECWWDHWVMDFLICNGLGIYLGMKTCEYLSMKTYHWRKLWKIPSLKGKVKRAVGQFTPYYWTSFQWGYTQSFKRFTFVFVLAVIWLVQELNTFYLKAILWIPINHELNLYRLIIYAPSGAVALREVYDYFNSRDNNAIIGRQSWIMFAIITVEVLIEIKFGWDILTTPVPWYFLAAWAALFVAIFIWAAWKFTVPFKEMPVIGPYYRRYILKKED